jgi:N-glycosidase YbiA
MYDNRIAGFFGEYRWLSNFWPCEITYDSIAFSSVEHAYVYAKCVLSPEQLDKLLASTPGGAKRLGRTAPVNPQFSQNKLAIMKKLLEIKFSHINLQQKLIDTHPAALIEVNNWGDTFWGVNEQGTGLNHLGYLLEEVRDSYREYLLK